MPFDDAVVYEREGDWVVMRWFGDVDLANATMIQSHALTSLRNSDVGLVLDVTGMTYIDSAGIRALISMRRLLDDRQQKLILVLPERSTLRRTLEVGGVVAVIPTYTSVPDAKAALETFPS